MWKVEIYEFSATLHCDMREICAKSWKKFKVCQGTKTQLKFLCFQFIFQDLFNVKHFALDVAIYIVDRLCYLSLAGWI